MNLFYFYFKIKQIKNKNKIKDIYFKKQNKYM